MSKRTFQRKLQALYINFRQFIEQHKVDYCHHLMSKTSMSLTEIALHLGYADQSSLGRAYNQNFGITPRSAQCQSASK